MNTPGADVRSIDALRDWLAALMTYRSAAVETLSGLQMEIRRASDWLEDQAKRWKATVRECQEELLQARNELQNRKYTTGVDDRVPDTTVQERNLRRAKARLEHAEEQVEKCRTWLLRMPKVIEETYDGSARRLTNFLEVDLPQATAMLNRQLAALESYAGLRREFAPPPS